MFMNKLYYSKKADVSIVLLVFMVVVLCGAALLLFVFSSSNSAKISEVGVISNLYGERAVFEYYLYNLAEEIFYKNPDINSNDFIIEFKKKFALDSKNNYGDEIYWQQIVNNSYNIKIENKTLKFVLKDFRFFKDFSNEDFSKIKTITYTADIFFEIRLQ